MKACITEISSKPQGIDSNEANKVQEAPVSGDAGNAFGGRASKRTKTLLASPLDLELIGLIMFIKFYLLTRLRGIRQLEQNHGDPSDQASSLQCTPQNRANYTPFNSLFSSQ